MTYHWLHERLACLLQRCTLRLLRLQEGLLQDRDLRSCEGIRRVNDRIEGGTAKALPSVSKHAHNRPRHKPESQEVHPDVLSVLVGEAGGEEGPPDELGHQIAEQS